MVLKILIFTLVFSYLNYTMAALLNAVNKQNEQTLLMFFALVLSICLNLWLLPKYLVNGAAISALLSNVILFIFTLWRVRKIIFLPLRDIITLFDKCLWPSVIMAATVVYLQNYWHFVFCIIAGVFVYVGTTFIFGGLTREDLNIKKFIL
jgi:O-antigen/teichoic acid export membrane protein